MINRLADGGNAEFSESQCLFLGFSMVCHLVSVDGVVYSSVLRSVCQDLDFPQNNSKSQLWAATNVIPVIKCKKPVSCLERLGEV